jgi:hypothetical protein
MKWPKRRSVAKQLAELFSQWREALDSDDPEATLEELLAEYERRQPGTIDPKLAREALRERLSQRRSKRESVKALRRRR